MKTTLDITRMSDELAALDALQDDVIPANDGSAQALLHPAHADLAAWLAAFYAHLHDGGAFWLEWTDAGRASTWHKTGKFSHNTSGRVNRYFGVHSVMNVPTRNSKGKPARPEHVRSQLSHVAAISCLFSEFDAKDYDGGKPAILAHLDTLPLPPSVIVDSGGGYHTYWLLVEPFILGSHDEMVKAQRAQSSWVQFTGGDVGAKDLARVLRVPGTRNYKPEYAPDFPLVTVVKGDLDLTYHLDDLVEFLPDDAPARLPARAPARAHRETRAQAIVKIARLLPQLSDTRRDDYDTWLAVGMVLHGAAGAAGLELWDEWSKVSAKYENGACADKWPTFAGARAGALGLGSLVKWAKDDRATSAALAAGDDGDAPRGEPDYMERNADEINALLAELTTIAAKRAAAKRAAAKKADADSDADAAPVFDLAIEYAYKDVCDRLAAIARGLNAGPRGRLADEVKATGAVGKTDFLRDVRGDVGTMATGRLQAEPLTTAGYMDLYKKWGYRFRLNLLNDDLENNGVYFSDPELDKLIAKVRDYGIEHADRVRVSVDHARESITVTGLGSAHHPVKDYLNALQWDGNDHITGLASYFTSADGLFSPWFRHWICGSVARVLCGGYQTPMLVLGGKQDLGKSYFARWVCPIPELFHEGRIVPDNKDCSLRQANTFVWEVGEIGSTTRKADIDALKFYITREFVRDRKPYARRDTVKPALANFIGTFNPDGAGFLVDQTGNRRFLTTNLDKIAWGYASLDVHQLWAQAVSIVQAGDDWKLTPEQTQERDEQNKVHLISNPTREALVSLYEFTGDPDDATTADSILQTLHTRRGFQVTRVTAVQIGKALKAIEGELAPSGVVITRKRKTTGGVKRTVYYGVKARQPGPPDDADDGDDHPMYLD